MIPETLLGLLAFVGSVGPGYVWVRVAELHRPQQQRSPLLEAAELAFVGLLCTSISAAVVLSIAERRHALGIDLVALSRHATTYLVQEPLRGIGVVAAILAGSFALAYAVARAVYRGEAPIMPGYSVWDRVFAPTDPARRAYAALELRDDRRFAGYVYAWDNGRREDTRDVALQAPIRAQLPGYAEQELGPDVHFMTVRDEDVLWLSVSQHPPPVTR